MEMEETDLPVDEMIIPPEESPAGPQQKPVQVLYLTNNLVLIAEIDEVLADIGQPDCKIINPCLIEDGKLSKWMSDLTLNTEMFMSSEKILTLVDPTTKLLNDYFETIK